MSTGNLTVTRALKFLVHVENTLGWVMPVPYGGVTYNRRKEATKLLEQMATKPQLYTWDNLELAVEFLRRQHETRSPRGVLRYVEAALERANAKPEVRPIGDQIDAAVAAENEREDEHSELWIGRLLRAQGPGRLEVLQQWQEARG